MYKRVWATALCLLLTTLVLAGCGKQGKQMILKEGALSIQNFKVLEQAETNEKNITFLTNAVNKSYGIDLEIVSEADKQNIFLITQEASANEIGYTLNELNKNAFRIVNKENSIYILSPSEEGMNRAISYFVKNLVSDDGMVLLDNEEKYIDLGKGVKDEIYIGEIPIENYKISYSNDALIPACEELQYYIQQTSNDVLEVVSKRAAKKSGIHLAVDKKLKEGKTFKIEDGQVYITAVDEEALYDGIYLFVDTYLGWIKAGEQEEHISGKTTSIHMPENVVEQEAWIEEREAIICLWNVNYTRGAYLDSDISLKNNILDFSEDQLYDYVKMLKYCGFTGIQVTEMCSTWAGTDSYETPHEKIRILAEAAHSLDMKFTLWVWGAEFSDCGWVDNEVTMGDAGQPFVYLNPEAVKSFEKYYSIYAELADCCDRVIGHYYDPGNLTRAEDIAYFAKMLKDKFQAVNPDIDFGISCWVDIYDKNIFIEALGNDVTLYECGHHDNEADYVSFRTQINELGCRMGTWAWNTCEMEIDQLAQMNFNMDIIRSVYHTARNYDHIAKPSYWSEMDSYHILNVFSLYCAGQMLINPDIDSELLLEQIAVSTVGMEYADEFAQMLSIIQEARSGHSWDTYFWSKENYVLKSENYDAELILSLCNRYIPVLQEMIDKKVEANTLPLPITLNELLQMMLPHLVQIRDFAEFRVELAKLENDFSQGEDIAKIERRLQEISDPIKEYTCIIGAWGQIEARAQYEMIEEFCSRTGISVPQDPVFHERRKQYILAQTSSYQREMKEPYELRAPYYQLGLAYGPEETNRLVEELVQEGLLIRMDNGSVYLADWENYIYHFD